MTSIAPLRSNWLLGAAALAVGSAVSAAPGMAQKPSPAEIQKHKTTPGGKYTSLDVMKDAKMEQPGAKPGVPPLPPPSSRKPTRSTSSAAPAAMACCARARPASR